MRDPCGRSFALASPPYAAEVTAIGATLRTLTHDGVDLVAGWPRGEPCPDYRGWVLMPWPNRVVGAAWRHGERLFRLPVTEPERSSALHGLVGRLMWTVLEQTPATVRLACVLPPGAGYPFRLQLEVAYALSAKGLAVELVTTNAGTEPAPYGVGHHPYLTVGRHVDDVELTLPAASVSTIDEAGAPGPPVSVAGTPFDFRAGRIVGSTRLDHAFTDLTSPTAVASVRDAASRREVLLRVVEGFRWLQVFTGDSLGPRAREALAIEPMSCPPDAFNNGTDLVILRPAESHRARFTIEARIGSGEL